MKRDFRHMLSHPVVRLEDVAALRNHLEKRYPEIDKHRRAQLMAQGIHRMLDAAMNGLEKLHRERIKQSLISTQLIEARQSVLKLDVMNGILNLDIQPDQLITKVWGWYVLNTGHDLTLAEFTEEAAPYLPKPVREAIQDHAERNLTYLHRSEAKPKEETKQASSPGKASEPVPRGPSKPGVPLKKKKYRLTPKGVALLQLTGTLALTVPLLVFWRPDISGLTAFLPPPRAAAPAAATDSPVYDLGPAVVSPFSETVWIAGDPLGLLEGTESTGSEASGGPVLRKPYYLHYQRVDTEKLLEYLEQRGSMLTRGDYLDRLLAYTREKDLNPLLLIAIMGQEQGYVRMDHPYADRIIQNPFNIYGSWETHSVGFEASMKEACFTIQQALLDLRMYEDPFIVINRRYAEDPNWYLGVKTIFRDLMAYCGGE